MLPDREFARYEPDGPDPYEFETPIPRLEGIKAHPRSAKPALSIMMAFTNYRRSQLARSLECLARQRWTDFEVLIAEMGVTQEMASIYAPFLDILNLKIVGVQRAGFLACPSRGFRALFPIARGKTWAIMNPELMLVPTAAEYLVRAHDRRWREKHDPQATTYGISRPVAEAVNTTYVNLRVGFLNPGQQHEIDELDWHTTAANLEEHPNFWGHKMGLSHRTNAEWMTKAQFPYWFCGSSPAKATLWEDMPEMRGHASLDLWLLNYRHICAYLDITSSKRLGYHQAHLITAVSPMDDGMNEDRYTSVRAILLNAMEKQRVLPPPGYEALQYEPKGLVFAPEDQPPEPKDLGDLPPEQKAKLVNGRFKVPVDGETRFCETKQALRERQAKKAAFFDPPIAPEPFSYPSQTVHVPEEPVKPAGVSMPEKRKKAVKKSKAVPEKPKRIRKPKAVPGSAIAKSKARAAEPLPIVAEAIPAAKPKKRSPDPFPVAEMPANIQTATSPRGAPGYQAEAITDEAHLAAVEDAQTRILEPGRFNEHGELIEVLDEGPCIPLAPEGQGLSVRIRRIAGIAEPIPEPPVETAEGKPETKGKRGGSNRGNR